MRRLALAIVLVGLGGSGCALAFDESRYTENHGRRDASIPADSSQEDVSCASGEVPCPGGCASPTSTKNCGTCGNDCARHGSSATCVGGVCTCPGDRCPATGDTFVCTNRSEDPLNCGMCGNKCGPGEYCRAGGCACMPPLVRCSSTSGCIDVGGHHEYCGSCTLRCSAADNTCRATAPLSDGTTTYKCTLDKYGCPSDRTHCDGDHCFDTKVDETNCGGCGFTCAPNEICANGICRPYVTRATACASGEADCAPLPGNSGRICVAGGACPG